MRRFVQLLITLFLITGCVSTRSFTPPEKIVGKTPGFNVTFHNPTNVTMYYDLLWVNHPYRDVNPGPKTFAGGELKAGKSRTVAQGYEKGLWIIKWSTGNTPNNVRIYIDYGLIIEEGDFHFIVTPVHVYCQSGCDMENEISTGFNVIKVFKD